jgi:hypothetical protein
MYDLEFLHIKCDLLHEKRGLVEISSDLSWNGIGHSVGNYPKQSSYFRIRKTRFLFFEEYKKKRKRK